MLTKKMLAAIDELLNSKDGVNLTGLVNDLALNEDERTEISIIVKLLLNNKLTLDTTTRYTHTFGGDFVQYEYLQHSYIRNIVEAKKTRYKYQASTDTFTVKDTYNTSMDIAEWESISTDYDEVLARAKKKYNEKNSKE